jgi:tetratricopeptide (TPR) repeat protein
MLEGTQIARCDATILCAPHGVGGVIAGNMNVVHPPAPPDPSDWMLADLSIALALHAAATGDRGEPGLCAWLAEACNRRGAALAAAGQFEAARVQFDAALAVVPRHLKALGNRASVLHLLGQVDAALASNDQALAIDPDRLDTLYNRGLMLLELGRLDAALECFDRVLAREPDHAAALGNRGTVLQGLGRLPEAIAAFRRVRALRPDDATACVNESLAHLAAGDYATAWPLYERRWETRLHAGRPEFTQPQWRGEADIAGKTILLYAEQGFGDTLQFCRYAPLLASRAHVVLLVPSALRRLLATLSDRVTVIDETNPLPPFDLQCPLLSLPLAFNTRVGSIPADVPYLSADQSALARWRQRLDRLPGRKIGLVWAGRSAGAQMETRMRDRRRSLALASLARLAELPDVSLVSLQKGDASSQAAETRADIVLHDWTWELNDFADTAALVAALDLVISVDTSVAHLAGALGRPVWILNRFDACWRWLQDRTDSPWYPTARLFRQTAPGDWNGVIAEVVAALREGSDQPAREKRQ